LSRDGNKADCKTFFIFSDIFAFLHDITAAAAAAAAALILI